MMKTKITTRKPMSHESLMDLLNKINKYVLFSCYSFKGSNGYIVGYSNDKILFDMIIELETKRTVIINSYRNLDYSEHTCYDIWLSNLLAAIISHHFNGYNKDLETFIPDSMFFDDYVLSLYPKGRLFPAGESIFNYWKRYREFRTAPKSYRNQLKLFRANFLENFMVKFISPYVDEMLLVDSALARINNKNQNSSKAT